MLQDAVQHATEVKRRHEKELMRKSNVVGVGVGLRMRSGRRTDEVCIVVSVKVKVPAQNIQPSDIVPPVIEGVPVDVVETGEIRAFRA